MKNEEVDEVIRKLGLEPLAEEGGWFRRIHTGAAGDAGRPICTTIYALFTREQFSALHRLDAVEQFFFLDGDAFEVFRIDADGKGRTEFLGQDSPHQVFEAGCWFGGIPVEGGTFDWSLISCVVTPGFEWAGFEIGQRNELLKMYPKFEEEIIRLTR
ncbi:cupin domain-containing protein [Pelagicoccus mobilis]|uniref:Cupin domain-containing protein n=1 Tax=Pelagicoccus mobilis TaxID=415221 RepID=A0A934VTC8_9BACT|nr:cupin domain-containing protein [Pelagicoccus mobilis]MBK1879394.1 cupin domain-containing protein [Pelagicoccus mobilis]